MPPDDQRPSVTLGVRIRTLRQQAGLSQRQLAGKEMTRAFISMVERGHAKPSLGKLQIIARRLEKPVGYLLEEREGQDQDVAEALLEAARRKVESGKFELAVPLLRQLIDASPIVVVSGEQGASELLASGSLSAVTSDTARGQNEARARYFLANCLSRLGQREEALAEAERAALRFQALGDRTRLVKASLLVGAIAYSLEDYRVARHAYDMVVRHSESLKTLQAEHAEALMWLGSTLVCLGDLSGAVTAYEEALRKSEWLKMENSRGLMSMGLGKALLDLGRIEESCEHTQRAVDLLAQVKSPDYVMALHNLGVIQAKRGKLDDAYRIYTECLRIYEVTGRLDKQASIYEELAWYWLNRANRKKANACAHQGLRLLDVKDNGILRGRLYRVLGKIVEQEGNAERACDYLQMSYDLLRRLRAEHEAKVSLETLRVVRSSQKPSPPPRV